MTPEVEELFTDGQFKFMDEEYDEAIEVFTRVIELEPGFGKAYQARAIAYLKKGDNAKAMDDINKAIEVEPENHRYHYHKGAIHLKNDELDEAVEALSRAIDLAPQYAPAYFLRSEVFDKLGEEEAAAADFNKEDVLREEQTHASKIVDFWR